MKKCRLCGKTDFFLRLNESSECYQCEKSMKSSENSLYDLFDQSIKVEVSVPGSIAKDFSRKDYYVYSWKIKETGEIFYIGKGRGSRAYSKHDRANEAEKIRERYETIVEILKDNLSEQEALDYETYEIKRVLNETTHRLTNRIIPFFAERNNGYGKSPNTPLYQFEVSPVLFVSEIEEHYFQKKCRKFDVVDFSCLKHVYFIEKSVSEEVIRTVYGGKFDSYLSDVQKWLKKIEANILKTKFAKSVTAWIYLTDDYLSNYELDMDRAINRNGKKVSCYHLIDVWKFLKSLELSEE